MRLTAPSRPFFFISLVLFLLAMLAKFDVINFGYITYSLIVAWIILAMGCVFKGI